MKTSTWNIKQSGYRISTLLSLLFLGVALTACGDSKANDSAAAALLALSGNTDGKELSSTTDAHHAGIPSGSLTDVSHKFAGFVRSGFINPANPANPVPDTDPLAGVAWFDYNNDGKLDLFVTNGGGYNNGLFRNNGDGTFTDVAVAAGVANGQGNAGVVTADINNDGCADIFLSGEGGIMAGIVQSANKMYLNNCNGTFTDISATAGLTGTPSSFAAAFGDINNDGYLDLFLTSAGSLSLHVQHKNTLYLNNGDNTFTDISASAGIDTALGACVVGFSDFDRDGKIDIYVGNCNDVNFATTPFELWRNNGDLTFTDVAPAAGIALGGYWMAFTLGDYDNDGDLDLFSTSVGTLGGPPSPFQNSPHSLFNNNGDGTYTDLGVASGLANWEFSWGASFTDINNDGHLDMVSVGSLPPFGGIGPGLANPGRYFVNNRDKTFTMAQSFGLENEWSSGLAAGDYNNDGLADIAMVTSSWISADFTTVLPGKIVLLENTSKRRNYITIRARGTVSNRDGVGALVKVKAGNLTQVREVRAGSSFLSMDSPWLTYGLGKKRHKHVKVTVKWPSGRMEVFRKRTKRTVTIVEGRGRRTHRF